MKNLIKIKGKIIFDPEHKTKKHVAQSVWKKVAYVEFGQDICEYYQWFLKKRFNLILNKPLRNAHVTFINTRFTDITINEEYEYDHNLSYKRNKKNRNIFIINKKKSLYNALKSKWDGKLIDVVINLDYHTSGRHWWLNVDYDHRDFLHSIRAEIGLDKPKFGLHMTIGLINDFSIDYSEYLKRLNEKGFIKLNERSGQRKNH